MQRLLENINNDVHKNFRNTVLISYLLLFYFLKVLISFLRFQAIFLFNFVVFHQRKNILQAGPTLGTLQEVNNPPVLGFLFYSIKAISFHFCSPCLSVESKTEKSLRFSPQKDLKCILVININFNKKNIKIKSILLKV